MTWPGAVYSLDVGIVGTDGVLTIDDTHRDIVLAVSKPQRKATIRTRAGWSISWAAIRRATWRSANCAGRWRRKPFVALACSLGLPTPAATAAEAHRNLMLTKALDLSAKRKQPVKLPLDPEEEKRVV